MAKRAPAHDYVFEIPGAWGNVEWGVTASGKCEGKDFYNSLVREFGASDGKKVQRRFLAIFSDIADSGYSPKMSPEPEKKIHGIKWEFKKKQIRFACFQDGRTWVITSGFFKPGAQKKLGDWPPEQLMRAKRIRIEHLNIFGGNEAE